MALRLPVPTRSVRRPSRLRSALTVGFAALVFVVLPLRIVLAAIDIAEWTTAWRTVNILTLLFVAPLELLPPLRTTLVGHLSVADLLATFLICGLAIYLLTLLTVRRRRS